MKIFNCIIVLLFAGITAQGFPCYRILCKDPLFTKPAKVRKPDSVILKAYCDSILSISKGDQHVRRDSNLAKDTVELLKQMAQVDSIDYLRYKHLIEKYGYISYDENYFSAVSPNPNIFTKIWAMELHYADTYSGLDLLNTIDKAITKGYCTKLDLYTSYITYVWRQFEFRNEGGNVFFFPDSRFRKKYGAELTHVHQAFLKHVREQDSMFSYITFRLKKEKGSTGICLLENKSFFKDEIITYLLQKNKADILNLFHYYFRRNKDEDIYDHDVSFVYLSRGAIGASSVALNELNYIWY